MYFDSEWNIVPEKNDAEFYVFFNDSDNASIGAVVDYYKSGQIQNYLEHTISFDLNENDN